MEDIQVEDEGYGSIPHTTQKAFKQVVEAIISVENRLESVENRLESVENRLEIR